MGKTKRSTMKNESKLNEQEAGAASRNNKKVSSEDDTNTNDIDAPLNSTGSPTTDSADDQWDVLRVFEDPNDSCECRTEECKSKAVVVWATTLDPTDEWPLCEECQEKDFGGWPANVTPPTHIQSNAHNEDEGKESCEVATEEKTEQTADATSTADETSDDKECDPSKVTLNSTSSPTTDPTEDPATDPAMDPTTEPTTNPTEDSTTDPTTDPTEDPTEDPADEVWDVLRVFQDPSNACVCRTEECESKAVVVWATTLDPTDEWPLCEECQEKDFGGWPENITPPKHIQSNVRNADEEMPDSKEGADNKESNDTPTAGGGEIEEVWDVKKVMSIADVNDCPIKCSTETCTLAAACVYVSNLEPEKWYTCLDCQENDYGGWPEPNELPINSMTQQHKDALISKCSRKKDLQMPHFAASPSKEYENKLVSHTITPLRNDMSTQTAGKKNGNSTVTPSTAVGLAGSKAPAVSNKPSKQALEYHRKWQEAAEAMGGPQARIVVAKGPAKKIIFDFLNDAFRPMNITQIYKALNAIVPSPVLKGCLDDMALDKSEGVFADSDDEEDKAPKKKAEPKASDDPYKGALSFKSGKSANSCLYYVDYTKLKNNGDGLLPDERNELTGDLHKTKAELDALKTTVKSMTLETDKLLSEPTNEELDARLEADEADLAELRGQAEAGRKLKVNEKYKQQIKRRIDAMTTVWRKRRRICMDFLIAMEENTDGTVSVKKCLKGDGQIDIDSDEAIVAAAVEYGQKQRARPTSNKMKRVLGGAKTAPKLSTKSGLAASESFVAVTLDSQGRIQRVHLEDEE